MLGQELKGIEFTIFDTETTGLSPASGDRIVEIAAVRFKDKQRLASFQSLINPKRPISEAAFRVNNITQAMLEDAPSIEQVLPDFIEFIQGSCLCSYNAPFDLGFLNSEIKHAGLENARSALETICVVDVLKMARRLMPQLERHALWFVADSLGINRQQSHRAFKDVELTLDVFHKLGQMISSKGITDFNNFLSLFGLNSHFLDSLNNQKIAKIEKAINLGMKLELKYLSSSQAKVTKRKVLPLEIKQERNRRYLIAYCELKDSKRTFNIDGILQLEVI